MATHSSVLAWRIPGTGEPGGLLSMGLHRVGHDHSDLAAAAAAVFIHVRKINLWVCYFFHWINSLFRSKKQLLQKLPNSCHCARPACWNMGQSLWLSSLFPHSDFHPARKTVAGTGTKHPFAVHLKAVFQRLPPLRPQVKQHRWKFVGVVIILLSSPCCNAVNHHLVIQSP